MVSAAVKPPQPPPEPAPANGYLLAHARLLATSYRRLTGRPLLAGDPAATAATEAADDLGWRLFEAPLAVLSHGTGDEPLFTYGNRTALRLFEMDWNELVRTPSRRSAEPVAQAERAALLARVAQAGFIDDYSGVRISRRGRRFRIARATVWMLEEDGQTVGQAAVFADWQLA